MMKIVIAGIGGVGGYFGGLLARHYADHPSIEIIFFARGKNREAIAENGLLVKKGKEDWIAKPSLVTDDASSIGIADVVIIASKTYHLDSLIQALTPCISSKTILLPIMNGVDSWEKIKRVFPGHSVLHGCVYLVSRLVAPGVVENSGNVESFFFGIPFHREEELIRLEAIFKSAEMQATCSPVIEQVVWEKFLFVSPIATATTFFNDSIGNILNDGEKKRALLQLIDEIHALAKKKGVQVADDLADRTIARLSALPYDTTSSMQADFVKGHITEWRSLTEYVVRESAIVGLKANRYAAMMERIAQ